MAHPLPPEIEAAILSILESETPDTNTALEAIRAEHPEHSREIERRLAATRRIRAQLSTDLTPVANIPCEP